MFVSIQLLFSLNNIHVYKYTEIALCTVLMNKLLLDFSHPGSETGFEMESWPCLMVNRISVGH